MATNHSTNPFPASGGVGGAGGSLSTRGAELLQKAQQSWLSSSELHEILSSFTLLSDTGERRVWTSFLGLAVSTAWITHAGYAATWFALSAAGAAMCVYI